MKFYIESSNNKIELIENPKYDADSPDRLKKNYLVYKKSIMHDTVYLI